MLVYIPDPEWNYGLAAAVGAVAATVAATAVVASIYCAVAGGTAAAAGGGVAAAAATASALLAKYGLAAREKASEQESHIENMLSTDHLEIKDAIVLPLADCVEYAIEKAYNGEEIGDR